MDQLDALRAFVAVAEARSFTEGARTARVSPTRASRAVAALEVELGVPLLRRTTRSVSLTGEGAAYLERARRALDELDAGARDARGEAQEPRGRLVVTAPVVFGRMHMLPVLNGLLRAHPRLDVELMLLDRVVRLVEEGIDVAVRIADLADSALHAVRLLEVRRMLVASPAYLAEHGAPAGVAALNDHALIGFDGLAAGGEWRFGPDSRTAVRIMPRLATNSVEAAIDAALAGLGIARALSYQVADHLAAGRLVALLPDAAPPPVPVHLLFAANRRRSPGVRALIDASRAYFGALAPPVALA